jgi:apolipoprotein N-acyltransferase
MRAFIKKIFVVISFVLITWGQPGVIAPFGLLASFFGYALFWFAIDKLASRKSRFCAGLVFFTLIQLVQLFWLLSHPYTYIYGAWVLLSLLMGVQFGLLSLLITRKRLSTLRGVLALSGLWMLFEWSRLFFFTGFTFDFAGLALACSLPTLQLASYIGILGMSFWVMLTNGLVLRALFLKKVHAGLLAIAIFLLPLGLGSYVLKMREEAKETFDQNHPPFSALIVETKEHPEEIENPNISKNPKLVALEHLERIFQAVAPYKHEPFNLLILPEMVVPFPATSPLFEQDAVQKLFYKCFHETLELKASRIGNQSYVSAEAISEGLAKVLGFPLLIGLEGVDQYGTEKTVYYNSAFFFFPHTRPTLRYNKELLLPMGEYIPFESVKSLAREYGLTASFTKGTRRLVVPLENGKAKVSACICYEDTFPPILRKDRLQGANLFVNITNDGWFPDSTLGLQHFENARVRTVENGTPLLRSCNFGISGAIDSLGQIILKKSPTEKVHAYPVHISLYNYPTLYTLFGDLFILVISIFFCLLELRSCSTISWTIGPRESSRD